MLLRVYPCRCAQTEPFNKEQYLHFFKDLKIPLYSKLFYYTDLYNMEMQIQGQYVGRYSSFANQSEAIKFGFDQVYRQAIMGQGSNEQKQQQHAQEVGQMVGDAFTMAATVQYAQSRTTAAQVQQNTQTSQQTATGNAQGKATANNSKTHGAVARTTQYGSGWEQTSLKEAIKKFTPDAIGQNNGKGKISYTNQQTGYSIVYDQAGNYFRILDKNNSPVGLNGSQINVGARKGTDASNFVKQKTHFNNTD